MKSIREFPRPTNISGVRAWFGIVEQVSFAFSKIREMGAFRELLSLKEEFSWNEDRQRDFEGAKQQKADKEEEGVRLFRVGRTTAFVTDWSKEGLGFFLLQKLCSCNEIMPRCCNKGAIAINIGSRFCSQAERNYSAIKGELLGVTWALDKTKHWTLGYLGLRVFTDHKPLIGLVRQTDLETVTPILL